MINYPLSNVFIGGINSILKHNLSSMELLKLHKNKTFMLQVMGISITAIIDADGQLKYFPTQKNTLNDLTNNSINNEYTINEDSTNMGIMDTYSTNRYHTNMCSTRIYIPISILTYSIDNNKLEAFRKITILGDKSFGRNLLEILSNLHFTQIYSIRNPFAQLAINRIHYILNMLKSQLILNINNFSYSAAEYLQYESQAIVNYHEIDTFCTQVDELKSRTELLTQRLALLK